MAGITNPVHPVLDNILNIRAMRIMACVAFLLGERSMRNLSLLSLVSLCVRGEAQFAALGIKKIFVFGGVSGMAGKASLFTDDRPMVECNLLTLFFMTIKTENIYFLANKLRVLRGMGLMAGAAHPFFEGGVIHRSSPLQLRDVMTIEAELTSCFSRAKRFWI
jgi:hypothetical protein